MKKNLLEIKFDDLRSEPNLFKYLFLFVIVGVVASFINLQMIDFETVIGKIDSSEDMEFVVTSTKVFMGIMYILTAFFSIIVYFIGFLILSKILNTSVRYVSIFSATIFMNLCTGIVGLIGLIVQFAFNIPLEEYNVLSLDFLDSNNSFLSSINLSLLTQTYFLYLVLYSTMKISKKTSLSLTCVYVIFNILMNLL